jgi:Histidine kinase-, DNA gyrase B-, and HSP90-like ATPase
LGGSSEPEFDLVVPGASALLQSLRGVGYSPWTAVADLIDNSITAGARRIHVDFIWRGPSSFVRILDDGRGMDQTELVAAMRPGSMSPLERRSASDLGRFGLGLKTASLSQCRVLTVISRKNSEVAARHWDLDYVAQVDKWRLLVGPPDDLGDEAEIPAVFKSGTMVLWSRMDRLVGSASPNDPAARARFFEIARTVERHLEMIFHRFLEGPRPRIQLFFNGGDEESRILPWNPFMQWHPATSATPTERITHRDGDVEVQGFVLPHKDMLTQDEFEAGGGPEGWLAHQGFFIYRNQRLLVPGGWPSLGAGRKWTRDDVHRLARICLNLSNSSDAEWKIDIKKSDAVPPSELRPRLRGLAERVRADAREVFAHRGGRGARSTSEVVRAWTSTRSAEGITYRIDRNHPSVRRVLDGAGDQRRMVEEMLTVIESTVPVQSIWLDTAERGDVPNAEAVGELSTDLSVSLRSLYMYMLGELRLTTTEARKRLLAIEPFSRYPASVNSLPDILR